MRRHRLRLRVPVRDPVSTLSTCARHVACGSIRAAVRSSTATLLFGLAVVVRVLVGLAYLHGGDTPFVLASDDGDAYVASARWLATGEPIVLTPRLAAKWTLAAPDPAARWPAAYWLLLAAQYRLLGYQHVSTLVVQALLGGALTLAAYALARQLLPARWPVVAAVLVACSSTLVYLASTLSAEALYVPLIVLGLALLVRRPVGCALLAGAAFGLAEATRPLALPIFLIALAWRARAAPLLLGGFAVVLAPFVLRDLLVQGHVALLSVGGAAAFHDAHGVGQLGPDLAGLGVDPYARGVSSSLLAVAAQPVQVAAAMTAALPQRLTVLFISGGWAPIGEPLLSALPVGVTLAARLAIVALAAYGALSLLYQPTTRRVAILLVATTLAVLVPALVLGLPLVRYRAPADPLLLIFLTAAFARVRLPSGRAAPDRIREYWQRALDHFVRRRERDAEVPG